MRLLLDSHVLVWALDDDRRLSPATRDQISEGADEVLVSAATIWELEIKRSIGRLKIEGELGEYCDQSGFIHLPIRFEHARAAAQLPRYHGDPFDRMLIAQARAEGLTLVTAADRIGDYDVPLLGP